MIQIYKAFNTDQTRNGDMVLMPSVATTHAVLNGSWSAELTHPIDPEGRWKYIEEEAIVEMPSFNGKQLYRIRSKKRQHPLCRQQWNLSFLILSMIVG